MYFYEPAKGHGLPHDPLNAIVGPRPIGWIASLDGQGRRNLAPYSFFNCFNYRPPIIGFASSGWKDSVQNIVESKEFVWNLTTRDLAVQMNETSASLAHGEDEFARAGLTPAESRLVRAPRVAESPVNFECRLSQCIQLTAADGSPIESWLVLGEVVAVHIDESLLEEGIYQTAKAQPVLRAGGPSAYYGISEDQRFDLVRPDNR
ncbi:MULTISPECIES: flavin reductase family protein [Kosakonia]|jgi:flavin reductase (DIM6/NTAB) family NADH-FMN oxidoreductase RutF|uniref:Asp/Glu/hydantoin racemase n=1 Tax=Kosakonia cowanii JCM 10956 = DSM 18146 TaxID=1300165 RepID=A0A807LEZ2_9ENTR|nr:MULTISPECIES: flavin reductase family protein [Kosakonia]MDP9768418.1 flavin reductase (DIM6/NTAB) family NADH-FMN oxidoreductase RutF [Atlantibacter hermannii]APZ05859.1 Asp/Glu/hydantoin racemase [Kosakonia cowanii JCM 10956 = DSM 18146]MDH2911593.1 flavin reductase family protein [Kosakonia sp. HypNH10]MDY0886654.1 flavin reductase family protein [Kosakonia sp. CFBP8986]QAR46976.1 flavin reductase family protein [Kosakonia cowanii]